MAETMAIPDPEAALLGWLAAHGGGICFYTPECQDRLVRVVRLYVRRGERDMSVECVLEEGVPLAHHLVSLWAKLHRALDESTGGVRRPGGWSQANG